MKRKSKWTRRNAKRVKLDISGTTKPAELLTTLAKAIEKHPALEVLRDKNNQSNRLMFDLRMSLFVAAASDPKRRTCLQPFPTSLKNFTKLKVHMSEISKIPAFATIDMSTQLPNLMWKILNWVVTNPLTIEPLVTEISAKIQELKTETKLQDLPDPNNTDVFIFNISPTEPKTAFTAAKKKYGSEYAYHGSSVKNFYSIINRGLLCSLNVASAHGHGTYMSTTLSVSKIYAFQGRGQGWSLSALGNNMMECVAVVEVVLSPQTKELSSIYLCDNDDHMRLSHLIVYSN